MHKHHNALGLASAPVDVTRGIDIARLGPVQPVTLVRPHAAARAARFFVEKFPGRSLYAVKANPSPDLLQILWDNGITHYDVASIAEVRLVARTLPQATLGFASRLFCHSAKPQPAPAATAAATTSTTAFFPTAISSLLEGGFILNRPVHFLKETITPFQPILNPSVTFVLY